MLVSNHNKSNLKNEIRCSTYLPGDYKWFKQIKCVGMVAISSPNKPLKPDSSWLVFWLGFQIYWHRHGFVNNPHSVHNVILFYKFYKTECWSMRCLKHDRYQRNEKMFHQ